MPNPWDKPQQTAPPASTGNPWDRPASSAAPAAATSAPAQPAPQEGLLDRLADWGTKVFPHVSPDDEAREASTFGTILPQSVDRFVSNAGNSMMRDLTALPKAAADYVGGAKELPDEIMHPMRTMAGHVFKPAQPGAKVIQPGEKIPEPTAADWSDYGADALGGVGAGILTGKAVDGLLKVPGAAKDFVAGDVDKPMPGTDITPRQRYERAKDFGVHLPPAQATESPILRGVDWINSDGLLSSPSHERLHGQNVDALTDATQGVLQRMSPLDPEAGGEKIRDPLAEDFNNLQNRANDAQGSMSPYEGEAARTKQQGLVQKSMDDLYDQASEGYKDVAENYGDMPANNVDGIRKVAGEVAAKNSRFSQQFPSLTSNRMNSVISDAGQLGSETQQGTMGLPRVNDLIRSRSALLDLTRDPEIVKSSYGGDIQRLIQAHDQAIMDSLPEDGRAAWRDANEKWESMKNTFDNPSSPYYHAIRGNSPAAMTEGIGGTSPEALRKLQTHVGDEGMGIVRRGNAQKLFGTAPDGSYDLEGFNGRLARMPEESRNSLFSNDQNDELRAIGDEYSEMRPFRSAAFTEDPESLVHGKGLGPQTAAGVRKLRDLPIQPEGALGPAAPRIGEEGMGALRRGVAEDLLGENSEGGFNFNQLPNRLKNLNEGYREELFGPDDHQTLKDIGATSKALDKDYNRSGSGKLGQKVIEAAKLMTGIPFLQYPVAKFMTSPAVSEWLMRPTKLPSRAFGRTAAVAATASSRKDPDR